MASAQPRVNTRQRYLRCGCAACLEAAIGPVAKMCGRFWEARDEETTAEFHERVQQWHDAQTAQET